jgi:hypothetical protein
VVTASAVTAVTAASAVAAVTAASTVAAAASAVAAAAASAVAAAASAASATVTAHVSSASAPLRSCGYRIVIRCRTAGRPYHGLDPASALAKDLSACGWLRSRIVTGFADVAIATVAPCSSSLWPRPSTGARGHPAVVRAAGSNYQSHDFTLSA